MPSNALVACPTLGPVRLLREGDQVNVRYLDTGAVFVLNAERPVEMLNTITAHDDATSVEVCEPTVLAVSQVTEDGERQTIMLSPDMALELVRIMDSFIAFPTGFSALQ